MHGTVSSDQSSYREAPDHLPNTNHLGNIARAYGEAYIETYEPPLSHIKLIRSLRICKTPALGGKVIKCQKCHHEHYVYFSCGNRHCSICQGIKREEWMDRMAAEMYDVPYVHLITTLPHQLNGLARNNQNIIYNLIMKVTNLTVREVSKTPAHLGATPGLISILHTFGSDMKYHVHVHSLLTFGGIDGQGNWVYPKHKKRVCKNKVFRDSFRDIFLEQLKIEFDKKRINYHLNYDQTIGELKEKNWSLFVSHPSMKTKTIEMYLARYVNRIAVTNSRIQYLKDREEVQLIYNDYRNQKQGEVAPKLIKPMHPMVFLHQLLQHVLPPYFQKVRRYGIHAYASKKKNAFIIQTKLKRNGRTIRTIMEIITHLLKIKPYECEKCGSREFEIETIKPNQAWVHKWISISRNKSPAGNHQINNLRLKEHKF